MRKIILSVVLAGASISVAPVAAAATANYSFSDCITQGDTSCSGKKIDSIASLSMTEITGGVAFELTSTAPTGSFIGGFYFNGSSGVLAWGAGQAYDGNKKPSFSSSPKGKSAASPEAYNWHIDFPNPNDYRFLAAETATWTIAGASLASFSGNANKMMIHLQNVPALNGGSEKVAAVTAVPEPESYAMLLAGLGLMGTIARRRNKSKAV